MAISDEQISLIFNMKGQESVDALTASIKAQELELKNLKMALDAGEISLAEFLDATRKTETGLETMNSALRTVRGDFSAGGRGLLGASYAFQDFTSQIRNGLGPALASIQNNIPQILMATGLSNPMIAAISAITVGLGLILPQIQKAFGQESQEEIEKTRKKLEEFAAEVKKVDDAMKKLKEAPTAEEMEEAANVKAILESRPTAARLQAEIARQAFKEEIAKFMPAEQVAALQAKITPVEKLPAFGTGPIIAATKEAQRQRAELERLARERVGAEMLAQAQIAGPAGEAARRQIMGRAPEDIRRQLEGVTVAEQRRVDEAEAQFNERNQLAREERIKRQEKSAQARKNDALWQRAENERWAATVHQEDLEKRQKEQAATEAKRKAAEENRQGRQAIQQQIRRGSELLQEQQEDREWGFRIANGLATQNDWLARRNQLEKRQWRHFAEGLQENVVGANAN
jgi:hypothetical protein